MESHKQHLESMRLLVSPEELNKVEQKLKRYLPQSATLLGGLVAKRTYKGIGDVIGTKFFHSDHSTLVVATPAFSQTDVQSISIFWEDEKEEEEKIVRLLLTIPDFDWTRHVFLYATPIELVEKVKKFALEGTLGEGKLEPHTYISKCFYYSLMVEPKENIQLPEELELRTLSAKHAPHLHSHWDYNFSERAEAYASYLETGVGIFQMKTALQNSQSGQRLVETKTPDHDQQDMFIPQQKDMLKTDQGDILKTEQEDILNSDQEDTFKAKQEYMQKSDDLPLAWTHLNIFNMLTNTFTMPEYRGKRLGHAVTLALTKISIQNTGYAAACIAHDNAVSMKLHQKLGFVKQHAVGYQLFRSLLASCSEHDIDKFV